MKYYDVSNHYELSETDNVFPVQVRAREGMVSNEMLLGYREAEISLDQTTAAELLPILQHFIETGELQSPNGEGCKV